VHNYEPQRNLTFSIFLADPESATDCFTGKGTERETHFHLVRDSNWLLVVPLLSLSTLCYSINLSPSAGRLPSHLPHHLPLSRLQPLFKHLQGYGVLLMCKLICLYDFNGHSFFFSRSHYVNLRGWIPLSRVSHLLMPNSACE